MLPVPVRFGISPGEYSAGRHICNVVLYRFAQNMDMSVPTNGQTPEGPRSVTLTNNFLIKSKIGLASERIVESVVDSVVD